MLNRNDFILYMPMKGNITDYGVNAYSTSNTGAVLTIDEAGLTNSAYELADATDRIEVTAAAGNTVATALNSEACVYFEADLRALSGSDFFRTIHQWGTSGQNSFTLTAANGGAFTQQFSMAASTDGTSASNTALSNTNSLDSNWNDWYINYLDNTTTVDVDFYKNGTSVSSGVDMQYAKTNSTQAMRIGAQNNTNDLGAVGVIKNVIVLNRNITSLERKFIKKFSNRKRVA